MWEDKFLTTSLKVQKKFTSQKLCIIQGMVFFKRVKEIVEFHFLTFNMLVNGELHVVNARYFENGCS